MPRIFRAIRVQIRPLTLSEHPCGLVKSVIAVSPFVHRHDDYPRGSVWSTSAWTQLGEGGHQLEHQCRPLDLCLLRPSPMEVITLYKVLKIAMVKIIMLYTMIIAAISMVTGYIPPPLAPPLRRPLTETENCLDCPFSWPPPALHCC